METLGLKNVNMLTKEQYDGVAEPATDELWAVEMDSDKDFKSNVIGWGTPDYTAGVAITYPDSSHKFTAPCDGIIVLFNYWTGANNFSTDTILYINGVETPFRGQSGGSYYENGNGTMSAYISKGDVIYLSRSARSARANTFYPLKGVN